uniref:Uncharacterized protein n=1 Tax=Arundo donax TaxID=35708 RepID=A0A0A9DBB5_ARUDO
MKYLFCPWTHMSCILNRLFSFSYAVQQRQELVDSQREVLREPHRRPQRLHRLLLPLGSPCRRRVPAAAATRPRCSSASVGSPSARTALPRCAVQARSSYVALSEAGCRRPGSHRPRRRPGSPATGTRCRPRPHLRRARR